MTEDTHERVVEKNSSEEEGSPNIMEQLATHLREEARGMVTALPRWMQ